MKYLITLLFAFSAVCSFSQSKSFVTLKEKFAETEDVTSVRVSSFVIRTVLWLSGDDDMRKEFENVRSIRIMTIPQREFAHRKVSAKGFKKVLAGDKFEEITSVRDQKDLVTVYLQEHSEDVNLYFLLIENNDEVTAVEIKGHLDPRKLIESHNKEKFTSL